MSMQTTIDSNSEASALLYAVGRVQGVGYRKFTLATARTLSLRGRVRNLSDGRVEVEVTGERGQISALIVALREGPARALVDSVEVQWCPKAQFVEHFLIDS